MKNKKKPESIKSDADLHAALKAAFKNYAEKQKDYKTADIVTAAQASIIHFIKKNYVVGEPPFAKQLDEIERFASFIQNTELNPKRRRGECLMLALYHLYPDIYGKVIGKEADPFHKDEREPKFWKAVVAGLENLLSSNKNS
jgi:hypothetical protein